MTEVRFVPCQIPPHRGTPGASAAQRLRMLEAALADAGPRLRIDTRELERPGPSYMANTLESLRKELGGVPLGLILGLDAFSGLSRWHRWEELFALAHIVVMRRPGYRTEMVKELCGVVESRVADRAAVLRNSSAGRVHFLTVTQLEISASQIRELIARGRSARYLTPDAVLALIRDERLYQSMPG